MTNWLYSSIIYQSGRDAAPTKLGVVVFGARPQWKLRDEFPVSDPVRVGMAARAIVNRIDDEGVGSEVAHIRKFFRQQANEVRIMEPRSIVATSARAALERAFEAEFTTHVEAPRQQANVCTWMTSVHYSTISFDSVWEAAEEAFTTIELAPWQLITTQTFELPFSEALFAFDLTPYMQLGFPHEPFASMTIPRAPSLTPSPFGWPSGQLSLALEPLVRYREQRWHVAAVPTVAAA